MEEFMKTLLTTIFALGFILALDSGHSAEAKRKHRVHVVHEAYAPAPVVYGPQYYAPPAYYYPVVYPYSVAYPYYYEAPCCYDYPLISPSLSFLFSF